MAGREYDYIKGNTVTVPQRKSRIRKPDKKYKQIQKRKKLNDRKTLLRNRRKSDRRYILTMIAVIFSCGFITVSGDSKVYNMQKKIGDLSAQISQTNEENEALKVTLIKFSALKNIQEKAGTKLSMSVPNKNETVKVDFSQNYFKDLDSKSSESSTKETSLFSKLKELFN